MPTLSSSDIETIIAVLEQVGTSEIKYPLLAQRLGLDKTGTANKRWARLKAKLGLGQAGSPERSPKALLEATPQSVKRSTPAIKKRKMRDIDDESGEKDTDGYTKKAEIQDHKPGMAELETPTRKMPKRAARVHTYTQVGSQVPAAGEDLGMGMEMGGMTYFGDDSSSDWDAEEV